MVSFWITTPGKGDSLVPLTRDTPVNGFTEEGVWFMWRAVLAGVSPAGGTRLSPPSQEFALMVIEREQARTAL